MIKEGKCLVNQKRIKANYNCQPGDVIEVEGPTAFKEETAVLPENIALDIIYEDADILVINKPRGMVVHPAPGHNQGTLVNAIMHHCGQNLSAISGAFRPGIVHRIDKDTTGLLVVAKNDEIHEQIAKELKEHNIFRRYEAIVQNNIKEDEGTITTFLDRANSDRKKNGSNQQWAPGHNPFYSFRKTKTRTIHLCQLLPGNRTHSSNQGTYGASWQSGFG